MTDDRIEAALRAWLSWLPGAGVSGHALLPRMRAAISAYHATPEAKPAPVGVKPLEWPLYAHPKALETAIDGLAHLDGYLFSHDPKKAFGIVSEAIYLLRALTPGYVLVPTRDEVIEECAKVADEMGFQWSISHDDKAYEVAADKIAAALRAMLAKVKPHDQ